MRLPKDVMIRDLQGFGRIIIFGNFNKSEVKKIDLCLVNYMLAAIGEEIIKPKKALWQKIKDLLNEGD